MSRAVPVDAGRAAQAPPNVDKRRWGVSGENIYQIGD
jgi:hypothetical protein